MDDPAQEAQRRAELLVSGWHREFRLFIGGGAGCDPQARRALILDVAAAIAGPLAEVERMKEDLTIAASRPKKAAAPK